MDTTHDYLLRAQHRLNAADTNEDPLTCCQQHRTLRFTAGALHTLFFLVRDMNASTRDRRRTLTAEPAGLTQAESEALLKALYGLDLAATYLNRAAVHASRLCELRSATDQPHD